MINNLFDNLELEASKNTKTKNKAKKSDKTPNLKDDINIGSNQLFGDEFAIKNIIKKVKAPKAEKEASAEQVLKSKKLSLPERLSIINTNVLKVLGKQKNNVLVIKDKETFSEYISKAISAGRVSIDTETNNSLDPITCKLMGLCLYVSGEKQAYIPVNHRDSETKERLSWQLTEQDIAYELERINNAKIDIIMHNGKFDYEVIKCTCGVKCIPTWDTMVCARLLNENELAGLKQQYIKYIDKEQEKYSIDKLFENIAYADVDPDIFALYAATDSLMTDKLYEVQKTELDKDEYGPHLAANGKYEVKGLRWLFYNIEMPIVIVTAEMELNGVAVDEEFGARLKTKYEAKLLEMDSDINTVIDTLKPVIESWKLMPASNQQLKIYVPKKTKMSQEKIEATYPEKDDIGRFKYGKAPIEQLEDPINLASPSQLAILFYDILGVPNNAKDGSRKTGKDELKTIKETLASYLPKLEEIEAEFDEEDDLNDVEDAIEMSKDEQEILKLGSAAKLADLLLKRRGIAKLVTTYIDVIPELVKHWPDGRIRFHLNSLGTDTGRYSSGGKLKFMENEEAVTVSGINIQNIPSRGDGKITRLLFKAAPGNRIIGSDYSGQELRMAAFLSQDEKLVNAYLDDQDVYSIIASSIYNMPYEDCLEFYPAGTELDIDGKKVITGKKTHLNKSGKERRATGKTMVLAGNYGMSGAGAGSLMGKTAKEGQELLDKYFEMFGGLKNAIDVSKQSLKDKGYVEDIVGRRRRLEDINIEPYEARLKYTQDTSARFNPFLICSDRQDLNDPETVWNMILSAYGIMSTAQHIASGEKFEAGSMYNETFNRLKKIANDPIHLLNEKYSDSKYSKTNFEKIMFDLQTTFDAIINKKRYVGTTYKNKQKINLDCSLANEYGDYKNSELRRIINKYISKYGNYYPDKIPNDPVNLFAWTGRIAQAGRQCFNASIQGSSATLTKKAMIDIFNNSRLSELGVKLIITVHDEVLVECKEAYADEVEKLLPQIMVNAAKEIGVTLPMKCDPFNVSRWYCDEYAAAIQEEFKKLEANGLSRENAIAKVIKSHEEVPETAIIKTIETGCDLDF